LGNKTWEILEQLENMRAAHPEKSNSRNKGITLKYLKRLPKDYQIGGTKHQRIVLKFIFLKLFVQTVDKIKVLK
jgi:hypothetical protein